MSLAKRITDPPKLPTPFPDEAHDRQYVRLEKAVAGGREPLEAELQLQLDTECPLPALVFLRNEPAAFNLTSLRRLRGFLRRSGYSSMNHAVLSIIAARSGKKSDEAAAERARRAYSRALAPLELGLPEIHGIRNREGVVLVVDYQDSFESWPGALEKFVEELHLAGYGAAVTLIGKTGTAVRDWIGPTPVYKIAERTSSGSRVERLHHLARDLQGRAREVRPSAVVGALAPEHAVACAQVAASLGVPHLWDYRVNELWRWHISDRQNHCRCAAHLSDSFTAQMRAEDQALKLSHTTLVKSTESEARLRLHGSANVLKSSPRTSVKRRAGRIDKLYIDVQGLTVTKVVELLLPLVFSGDPQHPGKEINLLRPPSENFVDRVASGLGPKNTVRPVESWWNLLDDVEAPQDSLVVLANAPGLKNADAYVSQLQEFLDRHFLVATPYFAGESLLSDHFGRTIRFDAGDGESLRKQVDAFEAIHFPLANLNLESRSAPRGHRNPESSDFHISAGEAESWSEWLLKNPSGHPENWFNAAFQSAAEVMERGWRHQEFKPVRVNEESDWSSLARGDRSHGFHFHAWKFMDSVVKEYQASGEAKYLQWAADMAVSWTNHMMRSTEETMAWYDMAIALRSPRLAGLLEMLVKHGGFEHHVRDLFGLALAHQDAHTARESFNPRNNHGFYAALGQVVLGDSLAVLPGMTALKVQGSERLTVMAEQQFISDGGHAEHSPDYHRMLLNTFQQAIDRGIIDHPSIVERIKRAADVLGWLVQPDGTLLQFGDSPATNMHRGQQRSISETTQFILSDGREGTPESSELFALPETGYAVVRSPQPTVEGDLRSSSYLAFMAGFHSRAHKHCDDLSMVWTHRGFEVLVDGGRYGYGDLLPKKSPLRKEGYYYDSPERQYVESSKAHNVVVLDGTNHDRRRSPYGSGLLEARQEDGSFKIVGRAPQNGWSHKRSLVFQEGKSLVVRDELFVDDDREHEFTVYFNLAGELELHAEGNRFKEFMVADGSIVQMNWEDESREELHHGAEDPLLGWRSRIDRHLVPTWLHARTGKLQSSLTLHTVFEVR